MPELPEVETIVRDLSKTLQGKIFSEVIVHDAFLLRQKKEDFIRRLKGQAIGKITRRGKAVIVRLASGEFLVIQPMMTGQLIVDGPKDKHTRVTFIFSDGSRSRSKTSDEEPRLSNDGFQQGETTKRSRSTTVRRNDAGESHQGKPNSVAGFGTASRLLYNDQRRFGQLRVVAKLDEIKHFNILGPEPFSKDFTPAFMREAFQKTTRPIKNVLLDHTFVAGIGNIYACEILFRSLLSPKRRARRINRAETQTIHRFITEVLKEAILHRGSSMRNYRDGSGKKGHFNERLMVYSRQGLPCPRCEQSIQRIVQAGRSTFYCGHCQK